MNNERRKALQAIIDELSEQKDAIATLADEENECYENLPEGIQMSERGEAMSENASDMEQAVSDLEDIISCLEEIIER